MSFYNQLLLIHFMIVNKQLILPQGTPAPDFSLQSTSNENITLSSFKGKKNVILVFYPADKTPVCTNQLTFYNELVSVFEGYNAQLLAINNDSLASHFEFANQLGLDFPLLSDETGTVLRSYGVFNHTSNTSLRALFVLDSTGTIQWSYLSPLNKNPGAGGILKALEKISPSN